MLASRLHGVRDLRRDEIPEPTPGPRDVKLRVAHNGICGTDLRYYFEQGPMGDRPQTLGHEFSGVITDVGDEVPASRVGERVCVCVMLSCGHCPACQKGLTNVCTGPGAGAIGCGADGGGLAEFVVAPSDLVFALPSNLSLAEGALVEPMSVAFNGVLRAAVEPDGHAVVVGAGPIGIGAALGLRATGVESVMLIEPAPARRETARALGFEVADPAESDVRAGVMSATSGAGADAVFVCASFPGAFTSSVPLCGARGRVMSIATFLDDVPFSPSDLLRSEIEIKASRGYTPQVFQHVMELLGEGHYPTSGWVEHVPWEDVVEGGLEPLRRGDQMKLLIDVAP